ncbi:aminotransferase class I/II-fold pyridoxal phosphate-dependent enzyme [Alienimonas californiensis]|uniref:8-amino-7-oxononanoate synthase n=1 Tax=Alienimonas californiensis TaxID=2527989 RepID=A0A517PBR1_9PLAN|nr:8-amino-7-oxononanoate synthase [Alienimonas californiensis]QDT16823.1 8-amino-7-oxononanoate synthase [Alienimonas californiensis]
MTGDAGDPLGWVAEELGRLDREGLRRPTRVCRTLPGGRVEIDGRELWNFGSNDYLGLASRTVPVAPTPRGASALPSGATASPAVVGRSPEIAELERTIAEFEGTEDAVVFPTGYAANLGTVSALTGPGDVVFLERDCHACLVDGAKLGGGKLRVWRRAGPRPKGSDGFDTRIPVAQAKLEHALRKAANTRRRWIVADGVFSMDGDVAPVPALLALAEKHDAVVILDEAHATGVYGDAGRGVAERFGVPPDHPRLIRTGTLSKAVGTAGGFVSGSRGLCDYLRHAAKSHIFSTALPPAAAAAAAANLRWIASPKGVAARERLKDSAAYVGRRVRMCLGIGRVLGSDGSPILPILFDSPGAAVAASATLTDAGFFVPAIRPPTVPRGTSRLRISFSAAQLDDAVGELTNVLCFALKDAA